MRKMILRFLPALLAALLWMPPVSVSAAGGYTVRLADAAGSSVVTVKPGDQITLTLSIENNPGIIGVGVQMHYPNGLSLSRRPENVSALDAVAGGQRIFSPSLANNPYLMWWNYALGDDNRKLIYASGELAKVTFTVAEDIPAGDYPITLSVPSDMNTTAGVDGNGVIQPDTNRPVTGITAVGCTIRVEGTAAPAPLPEPTQPSQPKPSTPVAPKPVDPPDVSGEATKPSAGKDATTETTKPTAGMDVTMETTQSTVEATGATEAATTVTRPKETIEVLDETAEKGKQEPAGLVGTPAGKRILVALGIVLLTGGTLFLALKRRPEDYQD